MICVASAGIRKMSRISVIAVALLILSSAIAWQNTRATNTAPLPVLYTLGGDFALPSTRGSNLQLAALRPDVVLLNFGYTSCPDVCPTALARMRDVIAAMPDAAVQPVFVTLDPARDTVDRLAPYVAAFDPRFIAATGSAAEIAAVAAQFHVYHATHVDEASATYSIDHSAQIYLVDALGRVRATFGESVTVPKMIATVRQLLTEAS